MRRGGVAAAAAATLVACASLAPISRAQEQAECAAQLREMKSTLDVDGRRNSTWRWAWTAIDIGLFVGQVALLPVIPTDARRIELGVNAAKAALVPALLALHPPRVIDDARLLDERVEATSLDGRVADACIARSRAREVLARDATDEQLTTGWIAHVFVVGGNVAVGVVEGLTLGDWLGAIVQAVSSIGVGELQILTQPTGALRARGLGIQGSF
jgi:hypothetical protein